MNAFGCIYKTATKETTVHTCMHLPDCIPVFYTDTILTQTSTITITVILTQALTMSQTLTLNLNPPKLYVWKSPITVCVPRQKRRLDFFTGCQTVSVDFQLFNFVCKGHGSGLRFCVVLTP